MKRSFLNTFILLFSLNSFSQLDSSLFCKVWVLTDAAYVTPGSNLTYIPSEQFDNDSTMYSYTIIDFGKDGKYSIQTNPYLTSVCDGGSYLLSSDWKIVGNMLEMIDTVVISDDLEPVKNSYVYELISVEKDKMILKYIR